MKRHMSTQIGTSLKIYKKIYTGKHRHSHIDSLRGTREAYKVTHMQRKAGKFTEAQACAQGEVHRPTLI